MDISVIGCSGKCVRFTSTFWIFGLVTSSPGFEVAVGGSVMLCARWKALLFVADS